MARHRLRLFTGEDQGATEATQISVRFGEIADALRDAARTNRTWLRDFEDEEIQLSEDLYEILCSYGRLRPGA